MAKSDNQEISSFLETAQNSENTGAWSKAIELRADAVRKLLEKPEAVPHPVALDPTNALEQLGEVHKPSKRSHDYLRRYWAQFRDLRLSARKVVEVGVQTPRSINMWEEFFPNAEIYGIDIDPACANFGGGRKKVFIGDQVDEQFLMNFVKETGGDFDIVIDDGLHTSYSMIKTFSYLYPALCDHGLYVIEDIQQKPEILSFLHALMECVNFMPPDFDLRNWPGLSTFGNEVPWLTRNTVGVSLYRYIAFIERGFNPRDNRFLLDPQAWKDRLAEQRKVVIDGIEALKKEGVSVTRDALIAKLGRAHINHINRYLSGSSD